MISPFLFNGVDDQNAATNLILREKAALLSIHGLAAEQQAIAAQQAILAHQQQQQQQNAQQQNAQQQQQSGQANPATTQPGQTALVNTLNNSFALQSSLLANGSNPIALNNLNNLSAMSNLAANIGAAAAASSLCNANSPTQSNKMLWRTHPAFQQEVYNLLAALPWYSALGNFKSTANSSAGLTNSSSTDQQMAALHQFWSAQSQLNGGSNQLALGNSNGLSEHPTNSLNSGPIRPTIHSTESILQTMNMNRYTPYSFSKKELQGDCN